MSSYKVCDKHTDAWIMEKMMTAEGSTFCPDKRIIDVSTLSKKLHEQDCRVLLVNTLEYRSKTKRCLSCEYYVGRYPTGKEILGK